MGMDIGRFFPQSGSVSLGHTVEKRRRVQESAPQPRQQNISRVCNASDSLVVQQLWSRMLEIFGAHSTLLLDLSHSCQKQEHMNRFLNQFAANTLVKYFGALIHWFSVCVSSRVDPWSLSKVGLSDLPQVGTSVEWPGA